MRPAIATTLSAVALLASLPADAKADSQRPEQQELPAIYWPAQERPKLDIREHYVDFDGAHVPMLSIRSSEVQFEIFKSQGLSLGNSPEPSYSAEASIASAPGLRITVSIFGGSEFLPNLEEATWEAYKRGLDNSPVPPEIVFENSNIGTQATPHVMGGSFRQIAYLDKSGSAEIKTRELFAMIEESLIVFKITGKSDSIDEYWSKIDSLIGEFSLS